jgi:hypothetical protein
MLLAGAATAAASRIEPPLQEAAQRESTPVASSAPLDTDADGENRGNGVAIDKLAQGNTQ